MEDRARLEAAMTTSATVPGTVTPEAAARIAALRFQAYIERMIAYARQNLPELERIEVVLYDRYDLGDEPGLAVDVYGTRPFDPADPTWDVSRWMVTEFPPEVLRHVIMDHHPGAPVASIRP
jgi:hypothetical protein